MTAHINKLRDDWIEQQKHDGELDYTLATQRDENLLIIGWNAAISTLQSMGMQFDEKAASNEGYDRANTDVSTPIKVIRTEWFIAGAKYQAEQDAAIIAAKDAEIKELVIKISRLNSDGAYLITDYKAQITALEAENKRMREALEQAQSFSATGHSIEATRVLDKALQKEAP